jgi:predicted RNase H-like nuclease (RuvC/YqgF family)
MPPLEVKQMMKDGVETSKPFKDLKLMVTRFVTRQDEKNAEFEKRLDEKDAEIARLRGRLDELSPEGDAGQ